MNQMIIKPNQTVYQCPYCKRNMLRKHSMEVHINWCYKNPEAKRACWTCLHLKQVEITQTRFYFNGYGEGEYEAKVKGYECAFRKIGLYPPMAERKELPIKYPEHFAEQQPFPTTCGDHNRDHNGDKY